MDTVWVVGNNCWVRHDANAFVEATILQIQGDAVMIKMADETQKKVKAAELLPRGQRQECVADMDELQELNSATVLQNVELLFGQKSPTGPGEGHSRIYSSVGPVLIAMNPFQPLPIYSAEWVEAYSKSSGNEMVKKKLGPHCYRTVEEAYANLRKVKHQSVIICGESGAGKTVTNRRMIDYLTEVAKPKGKAAQASAVDPQAISEANALLEAFGNAKTTRNENSSRFGKFTKLTFLAEDGYEIAGCSVDHYLLERSRVVSPLAAERNYHIFYQLLKSDQTQSLKLAGDAESYNYLRGTATCREMDDAQEWTATWDGMLKAGFKEQVRSSIVRSVAGVLHLGNVDFEGDDASCSVNPNTKAALDTACELLELDPAKLEKALLHEVIFPPGEEPIWKQIGVQFARAQRDTVAKTIYSRTFDKIVSGIGAALARNRPGGGAGNAGMHSDALEAEIGLLDIFGFEDMAKNGFEQLFINLTNERIQHLFNEIMFKRELAVYKAEGIDSVFNPGTDNIACVKLFTSPSNPPGIVKILSESALLKGGRDGAAFVQVLNSSFGRHPCFKVCVPQDAQRVAKAKGLKAPAGGRGGGAALDYRECFMVKHYAGTIMYTVERWVPKSIDSLHPHISQVLAASKSDFMRDIFEINKESQFARATVGEKFASQLEVLASNLEKGDSLFVRCIKSNSQMVPDLVDRKLVLEQLVNGGVIAALEMRHQGLPDRMEYAQFLFEFAGLGDKAYSKKDVRSQCERILADTFGKEAQMNGILAFGHTKVFMKAAVSSFLRAAASLRNRNLAKRVQLQWRIKMGTEKLKKVEDAWTEFQHGERLAHSSGLANLPMVAQALFAGNTKIHPVVLLLQDLKAKHGSDVHKIAGGLPGDKLESLRGIAEGVQRTVDNAVKLHKKAEQLLGMRISKAVNTVVTNLQKIQDVWQECQAISGVDEKDIEELRAAATAAEECLNMLQKQELKAIRSHGISIEVLENITDKQGQISRTEDDISPEINQMVNDAVSLVEKVDALANAIFRVRRAFLDEVNVFIMQMEAATLKLNELNEQSERFIAEGMTQVTDMVNQAINVQAEAQVVFEQATDVARFKTLVQEFTDSVTEAFRMFKEQQSELLKRESQKSAREKLQDQLNDLEEKIRTCTAEVQKVLVRSFGDPRGGPATASLEELQHDLSGLSYNLLPMEEWQPQVEALRKRGIEESTRIYSVVAEAKQERAEIFERRINAFNKQPPPPKKVEEKPLDPHEFIKQQNSQHFEDSLMAMHDTMDGLVAQGMTKVAMQRFANHFLKSLYFDPNHNGLMEAPANGNIRATKGAPDRRSASVGTRSQSPSTRSASVGPRMVTRETAAIVKRLDTKDRQSVDKLPTTVETLIDPVALQSVNKLPTTDETLQTAVQFAPGS